MKNKIILLFAFLYAVFTYGQAEVCGTVLNENFDVDGAIPSYWTEYNTSGRITVQGGRLRFNHNTSMPSAFCTFSPTANNATFSFDVTATRAAVNCQVHLISTTGKYLSSVALGIGTANIKHATSMSGGVPSGFVASDPAVGFPANKNFTISTKIDFATKTVDFYSNGTLMTADVPFLEDAVDISKVDIQLLYMYNNNGQFYFDNISLFDGEENRLLLNSNIAEAQSLLSNASIGTIYNQYPQSAVDNFQLAVDNANLVAVDCAAISSVVDTAILNLQTAEDVFTSSKVNDPVLKMYSGYNFTGDEHEVYCGYYNGGLGAYEDWGVSFKLEQGYMATFAEDINGLGFSKVYVAQDNDLEINLPEDLQNSISFIRVSPWYPVGKKGALGDGKWVTEDNYNASWYYNWGLGISIDSGNTQFVPMAWSKGDNYTSLANMEAVGENMSRNHILAFNEPDNSGQSNLTVEQALDAYPKLLASGLRIGAPGVENVQYSTSNDSFNEGSWIQEFMDGCIERGYRVDFIPAHDYVRRSKSTFLERFKALHDRYNLPVWVTEYNYGNPNMGSANLTVEKGYANIKSLTEALEAADYIERYNWYYFFGSNTGIGGITNGQLNITGEFYRDLDSPAPSYIQEVYPQGTLGVNDVEANHNILVYPNPAKAAFINIGYGQLSLSEDTVIQIYDTSGKIIIENKGAVNQIDISSLSSGLYLLKVVSEQLNETRKIIIE